MDSRIQSEGGTINRNGGGRCEYDNVTRGGYGNAGNTQRGVIREHEQERNTHDTSNILKFTKITNPSIIACGMIFTWIVIKRNVDGINMNDGSDEKDKSMGDRKEEKSEWMKRMTNRMKRATRSEIVKLRPHMEVGMMAHVPAIEGFLLVLWRTCLGQSSTSIQRKMWNLHTT